MIKLNNILKEILTPEFSQKILKGDIKRGDTLTLYHASENKVLNKTIPIHLGTRDQADDRIDMLWNYSPIFYLHEVIIRLENPYPKIIEDVDKGVGHKTSDFLEYGDYNEFIYRNKAEGFPDEKDNLSVFVVSLSKCLISSKIKEIIKTDD
jgi:hypothetical protein